MAEIVDQLRLEIDQALRDIGRVEQALDTALAPVEIEIDVDQAQLKQMEDTLREVQRIADRAATETQSIALAAGDAEANFEDVARALGISEDRARDMTREILEAQAAANRLEDASRDIARQLGLSDTEANRLVRSLKDADRAADNVNVTSTRTVGVFGNLRTAAAGIAAAFAAIGGAVLFTAAIRGANAAVQQYATLQDSINAVNVVFGEAAETVLDFGEISAQSAGLAQSAFNQAVVPIGSLLQNFGFDAREAADASVILVQRAADMASVLGGSVQDALTAVGAALRGEADPLERYGASISAARVEQFALAEGLAATKAEITPAITLQARYGLILKDTQRFAGDFANTATDLANAQKIAAEEATETAAAFGEALAPAFELILEQAVPVLQFFESLSVALGATATEAAGAASALPEVISGIVLGFGAFGDVIGGVGDALQTFPALFEDIAAGVVDGDASFSNFTAQLDQFNQRTANQFIRIASQSIPAAIARGMTPINAFGQAIAFLGQQDDGLLTIQQSFERLRIQAGLTDPQLQAVTRSLISQADELEFNADEVDFLTGRLNILNEELDTGGRANADYLASMAGFEDSLSTQGTRFTTFAGEVESGTDRAAAALAELSAAAERQQARTAAAFNLFEDLPDQISGSFTRAVEALRAQVESIADFDINIAILRALNLDALADEFLAQGVAAAGQLEQAINDIPAAIEADELLQGFGAIGEDAFNELVAKFISVGLTPADARKLAEQLSSPEVIEAAKDAGASVGAAQAGAYHDELTAEIDQLIPEVGDQIGGLVSAHWHLGAEAETAGGETGQSFLDGVLAEVTPDSVKAALSLFGIDIDLSAEGRESGASYMFGMQEAIASQTDSLKTTITGTLDTAIQKDSPPKLFLDAGFESGEAFWAGFNQADLTLKTALPSITGSIASGTLPGSITGANVALTINNPTMNDAVSDAARLAQIAGSVATTFNAVRPN